MKRSSLLLLLLMMSMTPLFSQVMHIATKQGDVEYRVQDVDSVYFILSDLSDSIATDSTNTIIPDSTDVVPDSTMIR